MYPDPNPNNKEVSDKEKDKRRFTLAIVFVVIIGLSLIAGILKFRQARDEVKKMTEEDQSRPMDKKIQDATTSSQESTEARVMANKPREKNSNKKKLVPSLMNNVPRRPLKKKVPLSQLKLGSRYIGEGGNKYLQVKNMAALPIEMKERFSADEIVDERNRKVLVLLKEGESFQDSMGIAYNSRTKRLAIITGTLKVRFSDKDSFDKRAENIRNGAREKSSFNGISLSLIEMESDLETLEKERNYWASLPGVKDVGIELLEAEITVK